MFLKTKYYPVNVSTKEIINIPFKRERNIFIAFKGTDFIGIKGQRLNENKCYAEFTVLKGDVKITATSKGAWEEDISNRDYTEQHSMPPWSDPTSVEPKKNQLAEISELQEQHSHATQAMFTEFVRMYREIQSMKINPEWLARTWKI